jgi:hypothetical protein
MKIVAGVLNHGFREFKVTSSVNLKLVNGPSSATDSYMSICPSTKNRVPAAVPSPGTAKALRLIEYMINATGVETGGSTEDPMHFVALTEFEVRLVGTKMGTKMETKMGTI